MGLLLLLPSLGQQLLGESGPALAKRCHTGLQTVLIGVVIGATVSLKALGRGGSLVRSPLSGADPAGRLAPRAHCTARSVSPRLRPGHVVGTCFGWLYLWARPRSTHPWWWAFEAVGVEVKPDQVPADVIPEFQRPIHGRGRGCCGGESRHDPRCEVRSPASRLFGLLGIGWRVGGEGAVHLLM